MPKEQKGCCRGSKGCKDQLLTTKAILPECKNRKKNICLAWIDYQTAFDRVLHVWRIKLLELIGINNKIRSFTKKTMSYQKTSRRLTAERKIIETEDKEIQRGIFQASSLLLPLLFCLGLISLRDRLNKLNTGYEEHKTKTKLLHLLYMRDLNLVVKQSSKN